MRLPQLLVTALIVLSSWSAAATTVLPLDVRHLVQQSTFIFQGTVLAVETKNLGARERPRIVTDITFNVTRTLKGKTPGPEFTLRLFGGSWGGYTLDIQGQPRFEPGEEVVLFLEWTGINWAVTGMNQGRYRIYRGKDGEKWARRGHEGLAVLQRDSAGRATVNRRPDEHPPMRLDKLLDLINMHKGN